MVEEINLETEPKSGRNKEEKQGRETRKRNKER